VEEKETMRTYKREIETYEALERSPHDGIPRFFGGVENAKHSVSVSDPKWFEVAVIGMEFCEGTDLYDFVDVAFEKDNFNVIRSYFNQIALAVKHLHTKIGFTHRDIKLDNIFLCESQQIKLLDFGFAKLAKDKNLENVVFRSLIGTPGYMAPEMIFDKCYTGEKVDIFSLGVVLYLLCFRRYPFSVKSKGLTDYEAYA
jgi:serine/threonine protein kinase